MKILVLALAYFVLGRLSLLLAIPPGYATAIWPAAGLALSAVLLCGRGMWPGVYLGSFFVNFSTAMHAPAPVSLTGLVVVPAVIATGASLQAVTGHALIRRFSGLPDKLIHLREIAGLIVFGGPASCVVSAITGVSALVAGDLLSAQNAPFSLLTWWVGDSIGVILFTPLLLVWMTPQRDRWRRRLSVTVPLTLTFSLVLLLFVMSSRWEQSEVKDAFIETTNNMAGRSVRTLGSGLDALYSVESFFESSEAVDRTGFSSFAGRLMDVYPSLMALSWNERVRHERRDAFEERQRKDFPCFRIRELAHGRQWVPASERAEYSVVTYIEPLAGNEAVIGFDVSSDPMRRETVARALSTGRMSATPAIELVQGSAKTGNGVLFLLPVHRETDHKDVVGYATAVVRINDVMEAAAIPGAEFIRIQLVDESGPGHPRTIYDNFPRRPASAETGRAPLVNREELTIGGRRWVLRCEALPEYVETHRSWASWAMLTAGLLFTGLLGVTLLSMTGRTILVEEMVTHRTRELEHSREQLAEAQNLARVGSWEWDVAADRAVWSDQLYRIFGLQNGTTEVTSRTHLEAIHPEDRARVEALLGDAFRSGSEFHFDYRILVDGNERTLQSRAEVIRDADGRALRMFGTCQDITEMKQAEQAVVAASRAKGEFVANVSHELRTPLNGIIGMLDIVRETPLDDEQEKYLTAASSAADSLLELINDILDISKMEAGKLDLEPIDFRFAESMEETALTLTAIAEQKGLLFQCTIAPDVPAQVVGDPGRLRQILLNLAANAIKFTEQGHVHVEVALEGASEDAVTLHFRVSDTGIGIPKERAAAIFDPYTQADSSTTRKFGGTGLGLSISAELVKRMGGRIWVESEVGAGSTFHFTTVFGVSRVPLQDAAAPAPSLNGASILVVDGRASNRSFLKDVLARWRISPETAEDGGAGIEAIARRSAAGTRFDMVIVDAFLPDMDGFEFVERIKEHPDSSSMPVMLITSTGRPGDAVLCRKAGISAYLSRPVSPTDILNTVAAVLGTSRDAEVGALVTRHTVRERRTSLSVLLAEDQPFNQMVATHLLEKEGHAVTVVENGRLAVEACRARSFDLVLMDVQMPVMDGLEATAEIRELEKSTGRHVCIVAMTARAMQGDREKCLAAGMDGYLTKPFRAREFLEMLEGMRLRLTPASPADPPEAGSAGTLIDRELLLSELHGDAGMLDTLAEMFRRQSRERLGELSEAIARSDLEAIHRNAHALKGAIGFWTQGAPYESAVNLEQRARAGDMDGTREAWRELAIECAALDRELDGLKAA